MNNKKELTRAQVIGVLTNGMMMGLDDEAIRAVFEQGWEGYKTLSNKELAAEYEQLMGETLKEAGYKGIYITGKDLSYYESMERCLHKTITEYFAGVKVAECDCKGTSFRDMTAEHRVIDILLFIKTKNSKH